MFPHIPMRRLATTLLLGTLFLAGCSADPMQEYFTQGEMLAQDMSTAAERFENVINTQGDILQWTEEQKGEVRDVVETMDTLKTQAEAMTVPEDIKDIHPLLVQSITELGDAIRGILAIAEKPDTATEAGLNALAKKAQDGEAHANEYLQKMEARIKEKYPQYVTDEEE